MGNRYPGTMNFKYSGFKNLGISDTTGVNSADLRNFKIADLKETGCSGIKGFKNSDMRGFGYSYIQGLGYLDLRDNENSGWNGQEVSETGFFDGIMENQNQNIMVHIKPIIEAKLTRNTHIKIAW